MCNVSIPSPCIHVMLTCFAIVDHPCGFTDQTDRLCTQPDLCTAGSSSEVPQLTSPPHCGVPRASNLLDDTATNLQTAHDGCDLWAGSGLAGPEAILTLPPAASPMSKGETHQPMSGFSTVYLLCFECQQAVGHHLVKACWQLLFLDNLQTRAQLQIAWLPVMHSMVLTTGLLDKAPDMTCRLFRTQCAQTDQPNAHWRSNLLGPTVHPEF